MEIFKPGKSGGYREKLGVKGLAKVLIEQNRPEIESENIVNLISDTSEMYFCVSLVDLGRECNNPFYNDEGRTKCAYSLDSRNLCPRFGPRKKT